MIQYDVIRRHPRKFYFTKHPHHAKRKSSAPNFTDLFTLEKLSLAGLSRKSFCTSLAFLRSPCPLVSARLHCLNVLSNWSVQTFPYSMCHSLASMR